MMTNIFRSRRLYLALFLLANFVVLQCIYWLAGQKETPTWATPLVGGFGGNVTSGIVSSFLFLILTFYLDAQTNEKIAHIETVAAKSETLLSRRERILENERVQNQFEEFMKRESYHDIRFPDLKSSHDSLGLEYTIAPLRNSTSGEPMKYETEMETMYVVKVVGPAHFQFMDQERRKLYDDSPIRDQEYSFCRFYNDSWHLGDSTHDIFHKFYLSGKIGPVQYGQTANKFMSAFEDPLKDQEKLVTFYLLPDGNPVPPEGGGCNAYEIYKDSGSNLFLRINDSQLKAIYYTNPPDTYDGTGWFLVIEHLRGYAHGEKLERIQAEVLARLGQLSLVPREIPWYNTEEHRRM